MKSESELESIVEETIQKDRYLRREPMNHVMLHKKAKDFIKFGLDGEQSKDNMNYQLGVKFLSRAIRAADSERSFLQKSIYLAARSQLFAKIGQTKSAIQDIVSVNELKEFYSLNPLRNYYIENTLDDVMTLAAIKETISKLESNGELPPEVAQFLRDQANVTQKLVVTTGKHGEELKDHDQRLKLLESAARNNDNGTEELTRSFLQLLNKGKVLESDVLELAKSFNRLKHENKKKLDRSEIESSAIKIPEQISNDPDLKQYYESLYNKLDSTMREAETTCSGHLEFVGSTKLSIMSGLMSIIPVPGVKQLASGGKSLGTLVTSNRNKEKAIKLISLHLDPASRQNILKQFAVEITSRERSRVIGHMKNLPNPEVTAKKNSKSFIDKVKDIFVVDIDDALYRKIDSHILGYIDAKKILWAIYKGKIDVSACKNETDVIRALVEIPNKYSYKGEKTYELNTPGAGFSTPWV